jgi:uncharacterized protein YndB with AHSA1/START domain
VANQVSVSKEIGAPADQVWAMVADLTRMGEWSPESDGVTWLRGATGATPGATFRGTNRNGKKKWSTTGEIVDAQPGRLLTFRVTAAGFKVAEWSYAFEVTAGGCLVTETWTDRRGRIAKAAGKPASGVADRATHNRAGMEETLERLKSAAEAAAGAG